MLPSESTGWTSGASKWAAVVVLGAASVAAVGWAMGREGSAFAGARAAAPVVVNQPSVPVSISAPSDASSKAVEPKPKPAEPATPAIRKLININTATAAELELLPGVGPALAKRIIEHRASKGPFKRIEDLDGVKGIGPRTIERVRKLVTVE